MTEFEVGLGREGAHYVARVQEAVALAEREGFAHVATDAELQALAPAAFYHSSYSIGPRVSGNLYTLFRDSHHPYVAALSVVRGYHPGGSDEASWDFLRHQYTVDGLSLDVFDGVNEVVIRVKGRGAALLSMAPDARAAEIARIAAMMFSPPWSIAVWLPRAPAGEDGGIALSTAPATPPFIIPAALERMDAGVLAGNLFYLSYKLHNFQREPRVIDPRAWSK